MPAAAFGTPGVIEVHMLSGQKHQVDLLFAAKSFLQQFGEPVAVVVHTDVTVDSATVERIQRHIPGVVVFTRKERDRLVEPILKERGFLQCIEFRRANIFAAKLIDAFILAKGTRQILVDSDCLAFRPLDRLRDLAHRDDTTCYFGMDPYEYPYSLPPDVLEKMWGVRIRPRLNAGFCMIARSAIQFDIIEKWLSCPGYPFREHCAEQTITAALASLGAAESLPTNEYNMGRTHTEAECRLIHYHGHYLDPVRFEMHHTGQAMVLEKLPKL
jgi:hypothetical protein